jgi:hypothetical protein
MHGNEWSLTIVHTAPSFVVVDKPGGLLSVPGRGLENQDCVASRIKTIFAAGIDQPAVHRLDMYTSGLMVLALTRGTIAIYLDSSSNDSSKKDISPCWMVSSRRNPGRSHSRFVLIPGIVRIRSMIPNTERSGRHSGNDWILGQGKPGWNSGRSPAVPINFDSMLPIL